MQLERERNRASTLQMDLESEINQSANLKREVSDEQRRLALREQDIQGLEVALNDLKENMGQDYAQKSRDFDNVKRAYDDVLSQADHLKFIMSKHRDEIGSANTINSELQAHSQMLLEKLNFQEQVIADLEDKNKRLTDLLNSQLYDKAQNYKEAVLDRLQMKRNPTPPVNYFEKQQRSITPDPSIHRDEDTFRAGAPEVPAQAVSAQRLANILRTHQLNQDTLNGHYIALQQQLNQQKHDVSPIRAHQVELAA